MQISNDHPRRTRSANRRKLTPLFVDKIEPDHLRLRVWDTDVRGLVMIVEPSGTKTWYSCYRRNGRPRWFRLGAVGSLGLSDAREAVRRINAKLTLDPSYDPQAEKAANRTQGTVADLFERYVAEHLDGLKSGKQGEYLLRQFVVPKIGKLSAAAVQRSDIRSLLNAVASASTRGQVHANVGAMFNWAIRNDHLAIAANPATGIQQQKQRSRERVLSDSEVALFWRGFDEGGLLAARILRLILLTGQRPGEVRHMRWQDIDIGEHQFTDNNGRAYKAYGAWWTLAGEPSVDGTWPGTKNGQTHRVWLSPPALAIIEDVRAERNVGTRWPFVFPSRSGKPFSSLDVSMQRVCKALGVEKPDKVTPHDLRRTHGTTITSLGFSRDQMNRIQNHKEGGIASVYDRHSYLHEARVIQEAVGERISALLLEVHPNKVIRLRTTTK